MDLLPCLASKYNARKHWTIGMQPIDVIPMIADKLLNTVYSKSRHTSVIQSGWLGTCKQIQDNL